jgi:hypothetical protein
MRFFRLQGIALVFAVSLALGFVMVTQPQSAYCQETTASMVGTITDSSGAAVSDATVTLVNTTTGAKYAETANAIGFYRFAAVPPGQGYEATFSAKGFATYKVSDIYLQVGVVRTQNATLAVGTNISTVEVTATSSEVTIDTTDATVGNNIDVRSLDSLPVQQRNGPQALFEMQAGVEDNGSVAGSRVDQNDVTLDGLDVNDMATGGAAYNSSPNGIEEGIRYQTIVGGAPVDSLEQFTGSVAGGTSDSGPGGGGQFTLVTKGGTNQFHGDLNEYNRNTSFVANSWFANNASPQVPRNHLIQNQFGGAIGGPIMVPHFFDGKDKAFFFFDFNDNHLIRSILAQRAVPLDNLRTGNGNVNYIYDAAGDTHQLTPTQFAAIDPKGIGTPSTWQTAFSTRFPEPNSTVAGDGVNSSGYLFNAPDSDIGTNYVGRVDVNLNSKMSLFAKFAFVRDDAVNNIEAFDNGGATNPDSDRSYNFVVGHTWQIGSAATNRLFLGDVVQKSANQVIGNPSDSTWNPNGTTFFTFDDGTGPALVSSLYLAPGGQYRRVPVPVVRDDFSWTKGRHTFGIGGSFKDILLHTQVTSDINTTEEGMGGLTLSLCGPTPSGATSPACGAGHPDLRPSDLETSGAEGNLAEYDWDQVFAFMIGRIGEVSSVFNYAANGTPLKQLTGDQRFYRNHQTELYMMDSFKVIPSLTITYGVGYQYFSVPYETRGLETVQSTSFQQYLQARVTQSEEGNTDIDAVPLISYSLGGKANGPGAPSMYQPEYKLLSPHVAFAWNPGFDKKLVINASGGIAYDRTVIAAIQQLQDGNSYLFQQPLPLPQGIGGDPYDSIKNDPRLDSHNDISNVPGVVAPPTPKSPYLPFANPASCAGASAAAGHTVDPCGLYLGSAFNSATIDTGLKTPYNINFNFGVQRQMPWDMVAKINYVGHLGRRLIGQADVNQVIDFPDNTGLSNQTLAQAMAGLTLQLRAGATAATVKPEPFFEDVMGSGYTVFLVNNWGPFAYRGDFGDTVQFMADTGAPPNVGSAAQFSENSFYANQGFSTYHGLLFTLNKNLSHGASFDFNYTYAHSIDNTSNFANSQGDTGIGGIGLICDILRPRECRGSSDFDIRHYITTDGTYELPFGKGRMFLNTIPRGLDEVIGKWDVSGLAIWHTGVPWSTVSNAFVASYSNDAPGILVGNPANVATHITKLPGGGVNIFADENQNTSLRTAASSFEGPIGFQIGPRNELRGPKFFNADLGLQKTFPIIGERLNFKFRADAFNALNHPNFNLPANNVYNGYDQQDVTSSSFGAISTTVEQPGNLNNGARVLQVSGRLEF